MDPVRYEVYLHRLWAIGEEGRMTLQRVTASPIVAQGGECMSSFHDAAEVKGTFGLCGEEPISDLRPLTCDFRPPTSVVKAVVDWGGSSVSFEYCRAERQYVFDASHPGSEMARSWRS